jgi:phenylpropionate dioxygenase-like ring-hydroxylating dioxygenase large terminal subunit
LEDRVEIQYQGERGQSGWISRLFERGRTSSYGRFILPSIAQIEYCGSGGVALLVTGYFTPVDADRQQVHAVVETPRGKVPGFVKRILLGLLFRRVLEQDRHILESQQKNIDRFKGEQFASTRLDLIRPGMMALMGKGPRPRGTPEADRVETFEL